MKLKKVISLVIVKTEQSFFTNFAPMRILYSFLFVTINFALFLFYKKVKTINRPKSMLNRTIYMGNHSASFMDPLVVASRNKAIIYFMTRSDVFTAFSKPFMWAMHMLPIYRQQDGVDTKEKNAEVFQKCTEALASKKSLLIYPEGLTDDVFIRRLKPIKKGAVRIGFTALEATNWKEKIYVAALGCNYTSPNVMRSEVLISNSDPVCLNDYRKEYEANSYKVIVYLTVKMEAAMKAQITHIEREEWSMFHEQIMCITGKGMNNLSYNKSLSLENRWRYSQKLANWLNTFSSGIPQEIEQLKEDLTIYFNKLKAKDIFDCDLKSKEENSFSKITCLLSIVALLPFAILGVFHCYLPYRLIKNFVEKYFKRDVFWGSTKMVLGTFTFGLVNIPIVIVLAKLLNQSFWIGLIYYISISLFWLSFVSLKLKFKQFVRMTNLSNINSDTLIKNRKDLERKIEEIVPNF